MIMVDNIGNVSDMGRPSTFTKDQMVDIVLCLGELKNVFKVRRKFAKHRFSETSSTLDLEEIRRAVANQGRRHQYGRYGNCHTWDFRYFKNR